MYAVHCGIVRKTIGKPNDGQEQHLQNSKLPYTQQIVNLHMM